MEADVPEWVAVSVGDGCTIAGIWKGLVEMHALRVIDRLPRMLGVQAQGARPLVDAFRQARDVVPGPARTVADSIGVGHPRNWRKALRAVRDWDAPFEYPGTRNPRRIITATPADIVALLAFHEVHHRAQAMNMLRHLGVATADLDFNALMFPVREI